MIKYVFREVLAIKNADVANPQKIGEALAKIAQEGGGKLTPQAVVETARNPKHSLHPFFEWDDAKAAEAFRVDQARSVIRSIHVEDGDAEEGHTFAFVSISDKSGTSYRAMQEVKESPALQDLVLKAAQRDLDAFERRYKALEDVCQVVREAQAIIARKRQKTESRASA